MERKLRFPFYIWLHSNRGHNCREMGVGRWEKKPVRNFLFVELSEEFFKCILFTSAL